MKIEVFHEQERGCWAIQLDCMQNNIDPNSFVSTCREYLNKNMFPDALWYHRWGSNSDGLQCVECYGPNAHEDAKAAAVILAGVASKGPTKRRKSV